MPLEYTIHEAIGMVWVIAKEPYTVDDAMSYAHDVVQDPRFRPGFCEFFDLRLLSESVFDYVDMGRLVQCQESLLPRRGKGPLAMVVSSPSVYGLGRMCQILAGDLGVRMGVFWEEEPALQFLANPDLYVLDYAGDPAAFPFTTSEN